MKKCYEKCFANIDGKCRALTEIYEKDCPFKKTPEQNALEQKRVDLRLRRIGGVKNQSKK